MIKVEVIEKFTLEDYKKLKNVEKVQKRKENEFGVKDTFECDKEMVDYLTGNNAFNKTVVKVIEIIPEKTNELSIKLTHDNKFENTTTTIYNPNIPTTNGLAINTEYKNPKPKKSKKSKK
jgi:hypothetical protein